MRTYTREIASAALAVTSAVVVFAKLQSYSWWLIGSWKGAVGVVAVLGASIALTNIKELIKMVDVPSLFESLLWMIAATAVVVSLASATTKESFVTTAVLIGLAWAAQATRHVWRSAKVHHRTHVMPAH